MESTISKSLASTSALNPLILRLHYHLSKAPPQRLSLPSRLIAHRLSRIYISRLHRPTSASVPAPSPVRSRSPAVRSNFLRCISSSASPFASAGGNGGGLGGESGGGGGGGGGSDSGDPKSKSVVAAADEPSALPSDVIILDVRGMTCGGCAASVKRILESQPQVSTASVNLTTETAIVWPVTEAKAVPSWQKELGEALAKHLTNCGFTSTLRGQEAIEGDVLP